MDVRKVIDSILRKYGNDILLQRRIEKYTSSEKKFSDTLERHTVRSMFPGSSLITNVAQEEEEGVVHQADMVYYFRWDVNPSEGDRIYEDIETGTYNLRVFLIDYSIPNRGQGGKVQYWTAGVTREVIE